MKDTKENILAASLSMFSKRGFEAVSIRDICKAVRVKESSIYYHFKNKQEIFDTLFERVDKLTDEKKHRFDLAFSRTEKISEEEFVAVAVNLLESFFLHPDVFPLISMLAIERYKSEAADSKYRYIVFDLPHQQESSVFAQMINRGMIRSHDPDALAGIYHSIIYAAFSELFANPTDIDEKLETVREKLKAQMRIFYSIL